MKCPKTTEKLCLKTVSNMPQSHEFFAKSLSVISLKFRKYDDSVGITFLLITYISVVKTR